MHEFQPIAKLLIYASQNRLIDSVKIHNESESANGWYDLIVVQGGLTEEGKVYLENPPSTSDDDELDDIFQSEPWIGDAGTDIDELWNQWKQGQS